MSTHHRIPARLSLWLRPLLVGVCVGVVCTTLLLLLCALLLYKLALPTTVVTPMALVALGLGGFGGGMAAGLCSREKGLLIGGLCGVLLALLLLIGGIADGRGPTWGYAVLEWAVLTVCSAAGGVLGVNRRHP